MVTSESELTLYRGCTGLMEKGKDLFLGDGVSGLGLLRPTVIPVSAGGASRWASSAASLGCFGRWCRFPGLPLRGPVP